MKDAVIAVHGHGGAPGIFLHVDAGLVRKLSGADDAGILGAGGIGDHHRNSQRGIRKLNPRREPQSQHHVHVMIGGNPFAEFPAHLIPDLAAFPGSGVKPVGDKLDAAAPGSLAEPFPGIRVIKGKCGFMKSGVHFEVAVMVQLVQKSPHHRLKFPVSAPLHHGEPHGLLAAPALRYHRRRLIKGSQMDGRIVNNHIFVPRLFPEALRHGSARNQENRCENKRRKPSCKHFFIHISFPPRSP